MTGITGLRSALRILNPKAPVTNSNKACSGYTWKQQCALSVYHHIANYTYLYTLLTKECVKVWTKENKLHKYSNCALVNQSQVIRYKILIRSVSTDTNLLEGMWEVHIGALLVSQNRIHNSLCFLYGSITEDRKKEWK